LLRPAAFTVIAYIATGVATVGYHELFEPADQRPHHRAPQAVLAHETSGDPPFAHAPRLGTCSRGARAIIAPLMDASRDGP